MSERRKRVYLFELDSVRTSDKEIIVGQEALYHEIVNNGNIVVMTFNQLVDSRAFFSLLSDPEYFENLIRLFEMGAIKISQFGETRTLAQYLINSMDPEKEFIYSGWPLKYTQRRLLALIKRSLIYSDLSELRGFIDGSRGAEAVRDLFIEVKEVEVQEEKKEEGKEEDKKEKENKEQDLNGEEHKKEERGKDKKKRTITKLFEANISLEEMKDILNRLYWLLKLVLRLSPYDIYFPPRNPKEFADLKLWNILDTVCDLQSSDENWKESTKLIQRLPCFGKKENNRSVYHHEILQQYKNRKVTPEACQVKTVYEYAEAIVDLCYLYTCEISIMNTSKHYNVDELLSENGPYPTFQADFMARLDQVWNISNPDGRFLLDDSSEFIEFTRVDEIPDFTEAVRYVSYICERERIIDRKRNRKDVNASGICPRKEVPSSDRKDFEVYRYEYKYGGQREDQKKSVLKTLHRRMRNASYCGLVAYGIEILVGLLEDNIALPFYGVFIWAFVSTLMFMLLSEWITSGLSSLLRHWWPEISISMSDAMGSLHKTMSDAWNIRFGVSDRYLNPLEVDKTEKYNDENPIFYITPAAIKKYKAFKNEVNKSIEDYESAKKQEHSGAAKKPGDPEPIKKYDNLFADSETYPFADLDKALPELLRDEELYGRQYGIVYRSKFNIFCVDPIIGKKHDYFPYERVIPTAGNGDVLVCVHKGRLVLLKQYRHAPRKIQYAFPRGFAEPGLTPEENALKELGEELHAKLKPGTSVVYLGGISPDSGLASTCANVYLVRLESYGYDKDYEGIKSVIEITPRQFEKLVKGNRQVTKESNQKRDFDDGFSLAAYQLYKAYMRRLS